MAIDTQNKRRSTIANLPVPDGSIDTADRPQVVWIYSGITISEPAIVVVSPGPEIRAGVDSLNVRSGQIINVPEISGATEI